MDATLWTGDGTGARAITNQYGFKPDLVWLKARGNTASNQLDDSVRGATAGCLYSDLTNAQDSNYPLTSINSNGFTLGNTASLISQSFLSQNASGTAYVGWQWQAGQGSNVTNTTGTITSTVSANTTAGFSVVSYTGNGTNGASIGHGLGVTPEFFIIKSRSSAQSWGVYHKSLSSPNNSYLLLESQAAQATFSGIWTPSSSTITFPTATTTTNGNTFTYVAYCWTPIAGFSQFGSYTGNASTNGPFVYTGFRPKFVLIKNTSSGATNWRLTDSSRSPYNVTNEVLSPSSNSAEFNETDFDFLSNGFKLRNSNIYANESGSTFIYMAFAENPFKYANAR